MLQINQVRGLLTAVIFSSIFLSASAQYGDYGTDINPLTTAAVDDIVYYGDYMDMSAATMSVTRCSTSRPMISTEILWSCTTNWQELNRSFWSVARSRAFVFATSSILIYPLKKRSQRVNSFTTMPKRTIGFSYTE